MTTDTNNYNNDYRYKREANEYEMYIKKREGKIK